jgi:site-specific DNA-methyltransferase (adenine-specific)
MKLIHGDCLEEMKNIPTGSIDLIVTDPPYGMNYQSNRRVVKEQFAKIAQDDNLDWLEPFLADCYRVLNNDTAFYTFCSWHNIDIFKQIFEKYFKLKNILVWNKNNHGSGDLKGAYAPKHEFILYGHKGRPLLQYKRVPDVIDCAKISSSKLVHPTEKPIDLLELFIKNNSKEGDNILDPFMGSGTTGIACLNLNRNFIGIEKDLTYFNIAKHKIETHN